MANARAVRGLEFFANYKLNYELVIFFFGSSASARVVRDLEFFAQVGRRQARERFVWKGHETGNDCQVNFTLLHFNKYIY